MPGPDIGHTQSRSHDTMHVIRSGSHALGLICLAALLTSCQRDTSPPAAPAAATQPAATPAPPSTPESASPTPTTTPPAETPPPAAAPPFTQAEDNPPAAPVAVTPPANVPAAAPEGPLGKDEIAKRATPAVALVLRRNTNMVVTAFCVDPAGVFVTHERVGQYGGDKGLRVILNAGTPDQREFKGKIVYTDKAPLQNGLAVVRVEDAKDLPTLPLGKIPAGTNALDLTSVGFPFTVSSIPGASFPKSQVRTGRGAPVWQNGQELTGIKHDRALHPGGYGAPLLDDRGQVVGVLIAADTALPVTQVRRMLSEAGVQPAEVAATRPAAPAAPPASAQVQAPPPAAPALPALPPPAPGKVLTRVEIGRLGKAATAFVEIRALRSSGSAFCVHPSGLFVTNAHVVGRLPVGGTVHLVLNSGEKNQQVLPATVVRSDQALDLALLRTTAAGTFPALTLGTADDLAELMDIVAFGFPFGTELAVNRGQYPAVSINAGSVTSLRRKDGELHRLQLDAALNPGNSGGPVLDQTGRLAGVVVSGVRIGGAASGVNFAIPVNHVRRFLAKPDLSFTPPALTQANLHQPVVFQARVAQVLPGATPLAVVLTLTTPDGTERRFPMEPKDGLYRAAVTVVEPPAGPVTVPVTVQFAKGSLRGTAADRPFTLGGNTYRLRDVSRIAGAPGPKVTFQSGEAVDGTPAGLEAVPVRLGGQEVPVNLGRATEVRVQPRAALRSLTLTVTASQDGREIGRASTTVAVPGG